MEDIIPSGVAVLMFVIAFFGLLFYREKPIVTSYCSTAVYAIILISALSWGARLIWS